MPILVSRKRLNSGFTLLELLVVITMLSLLAALGAQSYQRRNLSPYLAAIVNSLENAKFLAINQGRRFDLTCNEFAALVPNRFSMNCSNVLPTSEDNKTISFFSDGSSSGGSIAVINNGQKSTITIDWLTGKIEQN